MTLARCAPNHNPGFGYLFPGFGPPHFTQVPDIFFDEVAPNLSEAELRVALYLIRRTFGWKKDHDRISLKQMVSGITTRDGEVLDRGTGMSKAGVCKGVQGLVAKGVIVAERNRSVRKGDEPTTYRLRFEGDDAPVSTNQTPPCPPTRHPRVHQVDTQDTVLQDTGEQGESFSKAPPPILFPESEANPQAPVTVPRPGRVPQAPVTDTPPAPAPIPRSRNTAPVSPAPPPIPQIAVILSDFSNEMRDHTHTASNITQATRLYRQSGCSLDRYFTQLYAARTKTRKATGVSNRMAYFFEVLRQEIETRVETRQ